MPPASILPTTRPAPAMTGSRLDLAGCIILAGGLRPSPLVAAVGCSVLDMWIRCDRTVLDAWLDRIDELEPIAGTPPVRVVHDDLLPPPQPSARSRARVRVETDPEPVRGTAGLLRDLCLDYGPDQHVLVLEAARYLEGSLREIMSVHAARGADVTVATDEVGDPTGIYVIRRHTLDLVPATGFCDLKEQWLPEVAESTASVHEHALDAPGAVPLRSRHGLLAAACLANDTEPATPLAGASDGDAFVVEERTGLRVICAGAIVGPEATVIDSIVMPGAVIGAGALVVRSIVCPDAEVARNAEIADTVVRARAHRATEERQCA